MAIFTDNFNRSNGAIGANWTNINGTFLVASNQAIPGTLGGDSKAVSAYSAGSFANDQYAQVTLKDVSAFSGVAVRAATGAYTCFLAVASGANSVILRELSGTQIVIASGGPGFANGDVLRLEIRGSILTLKRNGFVVLTGTNGGISSGKAGIAGESTSAGAIDDWEGGDLPTTSIVYPLTIPVTANKTRIGMVNVVGESVSPFSLATQQYDWLSDRLSIEMSFPPLLRVDAAKMVAFMGSLRGKFGTFLAGDPMSKTAQGVHTGTPVTDGTSNQIRSQFLWTKGWTNSITGILKAGDNLQITGPSGVQRLYIVLEDANSNSSGQSQFQIYPRLRETIADATTIVISSAKGTFRSAANQAQWDIESFLMASFTLSGVEAL